MTKAGTERRVAVVVIHGIGFQQPFQTLDRVARHIVAAASAGASDAACDIAFRKFDEDDRTPKAGYSSDFWERSYFEVTHRPIDPAAPVYRFTLLEAYWGHRRDTTVKQAQGLGWLRARLSELRGAQVYFCQRRDGNQNRIRLVDPADPEDAARLGPGDRAMGRVKRTLLRHLLLGASLVGLVGGRIGALLGSLKDHLTSLVRWQDVVAYITTDPQNPLYRVRGEILDEIQERLEAIAAWASKPEAEVDAVVIVAHSLGSLILVDTINRMRQRPSGRKALGQLEPRAQLVLIGSPVEHVLRLVLFRRDPEATFRNATVLARIAWRLDRRTRAVAETIGIAGVDAQIDDPLFRAVPMVNYHAYADPISSEITTLADVENQARDYGDGMDGHLRYWDDPELYADVFRRVHARLEARAAGPAVG
jgi:hypothetical protein